MSRFKLKNYPRTKVKAKLHKESNDNVTKISATQQTSAPTAHPNMAVVHGIVGMFVA